MFDINQIKKILPQAYPFLMIDRIVDFKKGESLIAIKNITGNEWCFDGDVNAAYHFPETLLIEAAAQAALCVYQLSKIAPSELMPKYVLGRISAEIKDVVSIGDQLVLKACANKMLENGGYSDVFVFIGDVEVAKIEVIYSVVRRK